jgi:hypothetical protein
MSKRHRRIRINVFNTSEASIIDQVQTQLHDIDVNLISFLCTEIESVADRRKVKDMHKKAENLLVLFDQEMLLAQSQTELEMCLLGLQICRVKHSIDLLYNRIEFEDDMPLRALTNADFQDSKNKVESVDMCNIFSPKSSERNVQDLYDELFRFRINKMLHTYMVIGCDDQAMRTETNNTILGNTPNRPSGLSH